VISIKTKTFEFFEDEKLTFRRLTFNGDDFNPANVEIPILKTEVRLDGKMGDLENHVEMDFANQSVGFGRTGTQVCQIRF
jgi:hypothetical protein